MNDATRYAAACAQDVRATGLFSDTISNISALVGTVMATQAQICRSNGQDFWPVAGAEYAANVMTDYGSHPEDGEAIAMLTATAVYHALIGGASEGNDLKLWERL